MSKRDKKELILALGAARSGKSNWALKYAESNYNSCLFLATAEIFDDEMEERVMQHKKSRGTRWKLLEEPIEIAEKIEKNRIDTDVILVDCVTIWLSNVLLKLGKEGVPDYQGRLLNALRKRSGSIIVVANEVGAGVVPEHALGRIFRDLAGKLNQEISSIADKVVYLVAGIPLFIKDEAGE